MSTPRTVAVLGASGRTGRSVVDQALARGWQVLALGERPSGGRGGGGDVLPGRLDGVDQLDVLADFGGPIISALAPTPRSGGERLGDVLDALLPRIPGRRIVWVVGAAVPLSEGDRRLFHFLRTQSLARRRDPVFLEMIRELQLLRYSDARWAAARPPPGGRGGAPRGGRARGA